MARDSRSLVADFFRSNFSEDFGEVGLRDLAGHLGIGFASVRRAVDGLIASGDLEARKVAGGRGSYLWRGESVSRRLINPDLPGDQSVDSYQGDRALDRPGGYGGNEQGDSPDPIAEIAFLAESYGVNVRPFAAKFSKDVQTIVSKLGAAGAIAAYQEMVRQAGRWIHSGIVAARVTGGYSARRGRFLGGGWEVYSYLARAERAGMTPAQYLATRPHAVAR